MTTLTIPTLAGAAVLYDVTATREARGTGFQRTRRFTVVGHCGTIRADRKDAEIMRRFAFAFKREKEKEHARKG